MFIVFFLLHLEVVFTSARFSLTANVSHGTLYLFLDFCWNTIRCCLECTLTKFGYLFLSSPVVSRIVSHSNTYLSLISVVKKGPVIVFGGRCSCGVFFVGLVVFLPWLFDDRRHTLEKRVCLAIQCAIFSISCLSRRSLFVLYNCSHMCRSIIFPPFFDSLYWGM